MRAVGRAAIVGAATFAAIALLGRRADPDVPVAVQATAESRVVDRLRAVQRAQSTYHGVHGYYDSLECLVLGNCVLPVPYPARFLSAEVVGAMRSGDYRYQFFAGRKAEKPGSESVSPTAIVAYAVVAAPVDPRQPLGAFCADSRNEIYALAIGDTPPASDGWCLDSSRPVATPVADP